MHFFNKKFKHMYSVNKKLNKNHINNQKLNVSAISRPITYYGMPASAPCYSVRTKQLLSSSLP